MDFRFSSPTQKMVLSKDTLNAPYYRAYAEATARRYNREFFVPQDKPQKIQPTNIATVTSQRVSKKIKTCSVFSLIFSLIALIGLVLFVFFTIDAFKEMIESFKNELDWQTLVIPVGCAIVLIMGFFIAIRSTKRIISQKVYTKGILAAVFILIGALAIFAGALLREAGSIEILTKEFSTDFITAVHFSYYVILGAAVALLIVALCTPKMKRIKIKNY